MINPKDFQIGNYVVGIDDCYVDRENKVGEKIFRVCVIGEDFVKVDTGFGAMQRYEKNPIVSPSLEDLKPLEITSDILDKAYYLDGEGEKCTIKIWRGKHHLSVFSDYDYISFSVIDNKLWINETEIEIDLKGFHHLQNIVKGLSGVELKLEPKNKQT